MCIPAPLALTAVTTIGSFLVKARNDLKKADEHHKTEKLKREHTQETERQKQETEMQKRKHAQEKHDSTIFGAKIGVATTLLGIGVKYGPELYDALSRILVKIWKPLQAWWNSQTVAVIGATATGKDSLIARLQGKEIPTLHINTTAAEDVPAYQIDYDFPDGKNICFNVKEGMNVGGEEDNREDDWGQALNGSTVIFYLVDSAKLLREVSDLPKTWHELAPSTLRKEYPNLHRIKYDMQFISRQITPEQKLAIILNKVDLLPQESKNSSLFDEVIGSLVNNDLGSAKKSLKCVLPLSVKDTNIFNMTFPIILKEVSGS